LNQKSLKGGLLEMERQELVRKIAELKKWIEENEKNPAVELKYIEAARAMLTLMEEEENPIILESDFDEFWSSAEEEELDPDIFSFCAIAQ